MGLSLGSVNFSSFEVPSVVSFGGTQALAVHRLPGGTRVVDALGPDDSDIVWDGILTGAEATDRARVMDALRIAGEPVSLTWDEFSYAVIIADLQLAYCNSWWIPYRVKCLVVDDPTADGLPPAVSLLAAVANDLTSAANLTDISTATEAVSLAGTASAGSAAYAAASLSLAAASQSINTSIQAADSAISMGDIAATVRAAGSLAATTAARGYLARAMANYAQVTY